MSAVDLRALELKRILRLRDEPVAPYVYHVAHPEVPGIKIDRVDAHATVPVLFMRAVAFQGRARTLWICSAHLLYPTPEAARAAHNPNWRG